MWFSDLLLQDTKVLCSAKRTKNIWAEGLHQHLSNLSVLVAFYLMFCGTIPLGIGPRSGAVIGNILAFMTSTPILSPVLVALALS